MHLYLKNDINFDQPHQHIFFKDLYFIDLIQITFKLMIAFVL